MKSFLFNMVFMFLFMQVVSCRIKGHENQSNDTIIPELVKVPLGDPFILLWEGKYYAYGTYSTDGIAVFVSDDLLSWSSTTSLALHKDDVWADQWFWAPEV